MSQVEKPSFKEALLFWLKLGFISFGGPAGQISIMHTYLVEKKKWISEGKFLNALNYSMLLPGPEAQQLATYIGWMIHGKKGGLTAGLLFVLPSMFILIGLSSLYVTFGSIPWVYALFEGLKPAIIAIVVLALIKIGKKSLSNIVHYIIAVAAFIGIFFFRIPFPIIIIGAIITGFAIKHFAPSLLKSKEQNSATIKTDENNYYINLNTPSKKVDYSFLKLTKQVITTITLWIIPLVAFYFLSKDFIFWKHLSVFFTKAALVTFGGAYAVLPYVAQVSVEQFNWLSNLEMMDGLALGETTPGPLVMVLTFVGFMAGYNHFNSSLLMGSLGLITTTFYTFLPCFLFIFIGAPIIEKTQGNKNVKIILGLVSAAVVGVIFNLMIYLSKTVIFNDTIRLDNTNYSALLWVIVSFFALQKFKLNMILWIGISALFGLANYFMLSIL